MQNPASRYSIKTNQPSPYFFSKQEFDKMVLSTEEGTVLASFGQNWMEQGMSLRIKP